MVSAYSRHSFSRICKKCKKHFLGTHNQQWCSEKCFHLDHYKSKKRGFNHVCKICGKRFTTLGLWNVKYCSEECKNTTLPKRALYNVPTGTIGAIGELRVSVDLLQKGYAVFRALSPSCFCDLLISKNNKFFSVEVRTGYKIITGKIIFPPIKGVNPHLVAIVLPNEIVYKPDLEDLFKG